MDISAFPPLTAILDAASTGLRLLAELLEPVAGDVSAAASVVLVTLLVRAALIPAGVAQAKAEQSRSRLAPLLRDLQRRHARDRERLQRETMKLYADAGVSPFAGCLPLLAQAPVLGVVYTLFAVASIAGHPNALLAQQLLGVPLGTGLVGAVAAGAVTVPMLAVFAALIAVIVAAAEATRRTFRTPVGDRGDAAPLAAATGRLAGVLQFSTAVVALFVPLAAAIYLATTVVWTLCQRLLLRRRYPLATG
ncbi:YidC/Oxa1 family membrane protein insertase [Microbacterium insulae]|uniref:Membrane protein insertase YidC n=1 Tax=Microbacterium insulae TaxID=483014 RepID=A0ABW3AI65_9MICO